MKNNIKKLPWIWMTIGLVLIILTIIIIRTHHDADYKPRVCGGNQCFMVELARTPAEQEQGLMYRESMEEKNGMLFVFSKSDIYNFWMKNTLIPLDMIWIDDQFKVVKIMTAQPCVSDPCMVYNPEKLATYILEINAGMAEKHRITEGTNMRLINIQ